MEEDLDRMGKVLPDPKSQGYANNVNTDACLKNAKQPGADASVQFSAKAGKTPSSTAFTPILKDSDERMLQMQTLEHLFDPPTHPGWLGQDDINEIREHSQVFDGFLIHSLDRVDMQWLGRSSSGSCGDFFR